MTTVQSSPTHSRRAEVTERDARSVAEAAREAEWRKPSFAKQLFLGRLRMDLVHPHPARPRSRGARVRSSSTRCAFCETSVGGLAIEQEARIPDEVVRG